MNKSIVHSTIMARDVRPMVMTADQVEHFRELAALGINLSSFTAARMESVMREAGFAMDDTQGLLTTANLGTPIQFLQTWLPGFVRVLTGARKIDELIGIQTVGNWEDEEIIQGMLEPTGLAVPYSDAGNIPLSSWNMQFERRTVVRFEQGIKVGVLEEARAARIKVSTAAEKRGAAALSLEIRRNQIGFLGFNGGANRTYGFLNDPSLPAYVTAATGVGGVTWALKTFLEITADIRGMMARLQIASQDTINPEDTPMTLALATSVYQYLSVVSTTGQVSVRAWIKETYPKLRIVSAPELNNANGGANVAYLYPDTVDDGSSDDRRVWSQLVPTKYIALGVEKQAKAYVEDMGNASAGVMAKRPYAIQRLTGI